jgi:hypothetical protein
MRISGGSDAAINRMISNIAATSAEQAVSSGILAALLSVANTFDIALSVSATKAYALTVTGGIDLSDTANIIHLPHVMYSSPRTRSAVGDYGMSLVLLPQSVQNDCFTGGDNEGLPTTGGIFVGNANTARIDVTGLPSVFAVIADYSKSSQEPAEKKAEEAKKKELITAQAELAAKYAAMRYYRIRGSARTCSITAPYTPDAIMGNVVRFSLREGVYSYGVVMNIVHSFTPSGTDTTSFTLGVVYDSNEDIPFA